MRQEARREYARLTANKTARLVAYCYKGRQFTIAGCGEATSTRFPSRFGNHVSYKLHAETALLKKVKHPPKTIWVERYKADGTLTMAKPCKRCQRFLKRSGVRRVRYTNWLGEVETLLL